MRRDWKLIREILLAVEADDLETDDFIGPLDIASDADPEAVRVHTHCLMVEQSRLVQIGSASVPQLTFAGHDLLDAIREERVWDCCQKAIALNAGGLPTDVLLSVARRAIDLLRPAED